jgi:multicomponent Na+:H+ antiporter subunit D
VVHFAKGISGFFQRLTTSAALFFAVNLWLVLGYRKQHLAYKKEKLYKEMTYGTLPIGIGAVVAISFILIVFSLI